METNLKNRYFFLRHGQNIYQAEHPGIIYFWPDGNPPYNLTEQGKEELKKARELLKIMSDCAWKTGEPAFNFQNTMNRANSNKHLSKQVFTNP